MLYVPRAGILGKPDTWLEPDFFYVAAGTEARLYCDNYTTADIVVEVISAESAVYDRNTKADTYAALGVKELWLVDELSGIIEIRVLTNGHYESRAFNRDERIKSKVLPGFECAVRDVFEDQP